MWNKQREAAAAREKLKAVENDPDVVPGVAGGYIRMQYPEARKTQPRPQMISTRSTSTPLLPWRVE